MTPRIKLKEAKDVSHDAAIASLLRILPSVIVSLDREASKRGEPIASGLLRFVKTYNFVATAHLLHKVLPHISRLSLIFQKEDVDFTLLRLCLDATISTVSAYKTVEVDSALSSDLKYFDINTSDRMQTDFQKQVQEKYIDALATQLKDRLADVADLEPFSVYDHSKLPTESGEAFKTYGNHQLEHLCTQYGSGERADVSKEALFSEWAVLKQLLSQKYCEKSCKQFLTLISTDDTLATLFPNFSKLTSIARILSTSTAECEHCFSATRRVKTVLCNHTLEQLLRISLKGPALDFSFEKAADLWGSLHQRKITV